MDIESFFYIPVAPCSGEIIQAVMVSDVEFTIYFYNPNIHPHREYLIRKDENKRFADKNGIPFIEQIMIEMIGLSDKGYGKRTRESESVVQYALICV